MPRVSRACVRNMVPNLPAPIRATVTGFPAASRSRSFAWRFTSALHNKRKTETQARRRHKRPPFTIDIIALSGFRTKKPPDKPRRGYREKAVAARMFLGGLGQRLARPGAPFPNFGFDIVEVFS